MRIRVNLYGEFKNFSPFAGSGSFDLDLPQGALLESGLKMLQIPVNGSFTALINGKRADLAWELKEGDLLVIIPLICGG